MDIDKTIDKTTFKKMVFVYNAIETGWTVTKQDENTFIFKKPHRDDKHLLLDTYLTEFINYNFDIQNILNK
jgi:hypothetical protein